MVDRRLISLKDSVLRLNLSQKSNPARSSSSLTSLIMWKLLLLNEMRRIRKVSKIKVTLRVEHGKFRDDLTILNGSMTLCKKVIMEHPFHQFL